ncbi:putative RNA methyltransferase [Actinocorallia sp. A-T 12471]|uniref:putative RNA methyltransferase n=1 Tax=Actinocorallia sp. A-T 12471 TaxID=3089813 RepID=UPI0029CF00AD|nr:methyltransferase domain-containing protein [Actinocorallia sp. A-T 12471]MDX6744759.1 23S rRNA methyltransferase [Actinocorallia sp. A-T 12471]
MLSDVVDLLACPICADGLTLDGPVLRCPSRHSFDVAKQGYVSLLPGGAHTGTADTAAMVAARAAFLDAGHYAPLAVALADLASGTVLDAGAGTGHYLAACLRADSSASSRGSVGLALDLSKHATRRAARIPRVGAVVADLWKPLPIRDAVADTVLNVFAPRNPAEYRRVLRPGGRLLVATPGPDHLAELVGPLGLLSVDPHKDRRLADSLAGAFTLADATPLTIPLTLTRPEAVTLISMTPSAHHIPEPEIQTRLPSTPTITTTAHIRLATYLPT